MKLTEITEHQFQLEMIAKLLKKELPGHWKITNKGAMVSVVPNVELVGWVMFNEDSDTFTINYYRNGARQFGTNEIRYDEVVEEVKGDLEGLMFPTQEAYTPPPGYKVHDGETWERPISTPLIWRAIKRATEVEHKHVWSDIEGAEGRWTIRYSPEQNKDMDLRDMRYWYVHVHADEADGTVSENWFEIIPEDDDHLAIQPDGDGGYEIYSPDGEFKP